MRMVPIAGLVTVAACVSVAAASAQIIIDPDPSKTIVQSHFIDVEGYVVNPPAAWRGACTTSRCADPCTDTRCGDFLVQARDFANNPVPGARVWIDFSGCSDIAIACDQLTAETGQTLPNPGVVEGVTDANGRFTFKVQGHALASLVPGNTASPGTSAGVTCAQIYLEGVPITTLMVVAYDVNGAGSPSAAVNGVDVATVASEVVKAANGARERDDYNHSGTVNGADASFASRMAIDALLGSGSRDTGGICP